MKSATPEGHSFNLAVCLSNNHQQTAVRAPCVHNGTRVDSLGNFGNEQVGSQARWHAILLMHESSYLSIHAQCLQTPSSS